MNRTSIKDDARRPRYIETVHRVGYRFVPPVSTTTGSSGLAAHQLPVAHVSAEARPPAPTLVGREAGLARLNELAAGSFDGGRQVVFVTGEAGIGKTALV